MKPEDFEQKLREQGWREVPPGWRREILAAARAAQKSEPAAPARRQFLVCLDTVAGWLWPSPRAWAGLAAVWVILIIANLSLSVQSVTLNPQVARHAIETWRHQQRLMAELLEPPPLSKPETRPAPRSERSTIHLG